MAEPLDLHVLAATLHAYPVASQEAGRAWRERPYWDWVDAVVWVASRSEDFASLLAAHRHFATHGESFMPNDADEGTPRWIKTPVSASNANAECAYIARQLFPEGLVAADLDLRAGLASKKKKVSGIGREGGEGVPVGIPRRAWGSDTYPRDLENVITATDGKEVFYSDLMVEGTGLLETWPPTPVPVEPAPAPPRRRAQQPTRQQIYLGMFFEGAEGSGHMRDGRAALGEAALYAKYVAWVMEDPKLGKPKRGEPMERTRFQVWRNRYDYERERWHKKPGQGRDKE